MRFVLVTNWITDYMDTTFFIYVSVLKNFYAGRVSWGRQLPAGPNWNEQDCGG
jgi:hypothetical protein